MSSDNHGNKDLESAVETDNCDGDTSNYSPLGISIFIIMIFMGVIGLSQTGIFASSGSTQTENGDYGYRVGPNNTIIMDPALGIGSATESYTPEAMKEQDSTPTDATESTSTPTDTTASESKKVDPINNSEVQVNKESDDENSVNSENQPNAEDFSAPENSSSSQDVGGNSVQNESQNYSRSILSQPIDLKISDINMSAVVEELPESSIIDRGDYVEIKPPFDKSTAYWWNQSGLAGKNSSDSVMLYGHSSSQYGDYIFSLLENENLKTGSLIEIETSQGVVKYQVREVMKNKDRNVLLNDESVQTYKPGYNDLLLVTCDNVSYWGTSNENIVVVASLFE